MSVDEIVRKVLQDGEAEAASIIAEAEKAAARIRAEGDAALQKELDGLREEESKHLATVKRRALSQARRDAENEFLDAREDLLDLAFEQAREKLSVLDGAPYQAYIKKRLDEAVEVLGKDFTVQVARVEDAKLFEKLAGKNRVSRVTAHGIGGMVMRSSDGTRSVDARFDTVLDRDRFKLRQGAARILFGEA